MWHLYCDYCRTAIYLALAAINVTGFEVILPAFTCATTLPDAIVQAGGIPVFVEIEKRNFQIKLDELKKLITSKTKAIVSHHYFGSYCKNVEYIQEIADEKGLFHIEDFAHCLGIKKEPVGDIAVYSYSKNLINPGGGKVLFRKQELFDEAYRIQKSNANPFHSFITNYETFAYMRALKLDRLNGAKNNSKNISFSIKHLIVKILKFSCLYPKRYFYQISDFDLGKRFRQLDTRMTREQKSMIFCSLMYLEDKVLERKKKACRLNKIFPSYLDINDNIFTNYVVFANSVTDLENICIRMGIRTRRPWPVFQKYWSGQYTEGVNYIANNILLLDIDSFGQKSYEFLKREFHANSLL